MTTSSVASASPRVVRLCVMLLAFGLVLVAPTLGGFPMMIMVCATIIAISFGSLLLQKPMSFVWGILLLQFFSFLSSNTYFPGLYARAYSVIRYLDDLFLIPMAIILVGRLVYRQPIGGRGIVVLVGVAAMQGLMSGLMHGSGVVNVGRFLIAYYRHVLLFVFTVSLFQNSRREYSFIIKWVIFIMIAQLVFNLFYSFGIPILPSRFLDNPFDWAIGTMGLSSTMSYFALVFIGLAIAEISAAKSARTRLLWILGAAAGVVMCVWANTKHALALAAAQLSIITLLSSHRNLLRKIVMLIVALALIALIADQYNAYYREKRRSFYEQRALRLASQDKVTVYRNVFKELTETDSWIMGRGPGLYSSVVAMWNESPLFLKHFYAEIFANRYNPRSSIMLYPRSGVLSLLGDTGVLGLISYLSILGAIWLKVFRQVTHGKYDSDLHARALAVGWLGWACFFILLNVITDSLHFGLTPILTFTWAGFVWSPPSINEEGVPLELKDDS